MSMPFYVAPEQMMKDRADYARKGIARGQPRCGHLRRRHPHRRREPQQHPAQGQRDLRPHRVRRSGPLQRVRPAAGRRRPCRRPQGLRVQPRGRRCSLARQPVLADPRPDLHSRGEADGGRDPRRRGPRRTPVSDQMFHVLYDGTVVDEHHYSVLGGDSEVINERVAETWSEDLSCATRCGSRSGRSQAPIARSAPTTSRLRCWPAATVVARSAGSMTIRLQSFSADFRRSRPGLRPAVATRVIGETEARHEHAATHRGSHGRELLDRRRHTRWRAATTPTAGAGRVGQHAHDHREEYEFAMTVRPRAASCRSPSTMTGKEPHILVPLKLQPGKTSADALPILSSEEQPDPAALAEVFDAARRLVLRHPRSAPSGRRRDERGRLPDGKLRAGLLPAFARRHAPRRAGHGRRLRRSLSGDTPAPRRRAPSRSPPTRFTAPDGVQSGIYAVTNSSDDAVRLQHGRADRGVDRRLRRGDRCVLRIDRQRRGRAARVPRPARRRLQRVDAAGLDRLHRGRPRVGSLCDCRQQRRRDGRDARVRRVRGLG